MTGVSDDGLLIGQLHLEEAEPTLVPRVRLVRATVGLSRLHVVRKDTGDTRPDLPILLRVAYPMSLSLSSRRSHQRRPDEQEDS